MKSGDEISNVGLLVCSKVVCIVDYVFRAHFQLVGGILKEDAHRVLCARVRFEVTRQGMDKSN